MRVVEKLELPVIEDNVYGFLGNEPPLAALAPESCIVIEGLSKRIAPGLSLGFVVPPGDGCVRASGPRCVRADGWLLDTRLPRLNG